MLDAFVFWPINSVENISTRAPLPSNPDSMDIQLYDCFLSFYHSSLTFKLSNKTALKKYSTRYFLGKGRLISQVSDKSANSERISCSGFLEQICAEHLRNAQASKYDILVDCLDIFYWVFNCMIIKAYKICAKIIQFHHEDGYVSIQCYYHSNHTS